MRRRGVPVTEQETVQIEKLSTQQWKELAEANIDFPIIVYTQGISMWPLLRSTGDHVQMVYPRRELVVGDIITFLRADGREITHRIYKIEGDRIETLGDNCDRTDGWINRSEVLGLVTHTCRKGKMKHVDTKFWRRYGKMMMATMPFRMFIRNKLFRPVRHFLWRLCKKKKASKKNET